MPILIYDKPGEPPVYMATPIEMSGDLNELLPNAAPGTIVQLCGGANKQQKDPDGNWNGEGQMPTPNAVFTATDADAGTLTNVMTGMTYQIDEETPVEIAATSVALSSLTACTISVVLTGTVDSPTQEITVTQADTPTTPAKTDPTTLANDDGTITGVTPEMEWKLSTDADWTDGTGETITELVPGTYYVRVKAAGTVLASSNQSLTISAYEGTPETTPEATFEWTGDGTGKLSNLVKKGHYVGTGAATLDFTLTGTATTKDITGVEAGTLSLVKKGDGVHTTDSTAQSITIEEPEG